MGRVEERKGRGGARACFPTHNFWLRHWMLCDHSLSFFYSFCHSVNRITDERGNGRQPILAGTGKR